MPNFTVTLTETSTYTRNITADSHLEAEQLAVGWRSLMQPDHSSFTTLAVRIKPQLPLQSLDCHPTTHPDFEHLLGDVICASDLVRVPGGVDATGRAPFVLASTTNRVGNVTTSHDTVLRYRGAQEFPSYPKDALEATGYAANSHLRMCYSIIADITGEMAGDADRCMFLVISSKSQISVFDGRGVAMLKDSDDAFLCCYLPILDLPFLPCVLVNPSLRDSFTKRKEAVEQVWKKMSPTWLEVANV